MPSLCKMFKSCQKPYINSKRASATELVKQSSNWRPRSTEWRPPAFDHEPMSPSWTLHMPGSCKAGSTGPTCQGCLKTQGVTTSKHSQLRRPLQPMGWRQAESRQVTGDEVVHLVTIAPSSEHITNVSFACRWDTGSANVSGHMRRAKGHIAESVEIIPMSTCKFVAFPGGKLENEGQENANTTAKSTFPTKTNALKNSWATCSLMTMNPLKKMSSSSRPSMELSR